MAALSRSTATLAQENNCVLRMRQGPATTDDLRAVGVYQVSARIFGLRARGYVINTELHDGIGADGFWHRRMARYTLISEPLPFDAKAEAVAMTDAPESEPCSPTTPRPFESAQLAIQAAGSEGTA